MANVIFKVGTKAQYDALTTRDENTLYWLHDVLELRKGEALYGTGADATNLASGLMSATDKAKLDQISVDESGLVSIDAVPIEKVTGLSERLEELEALASTGGAVATSESAGIVKPGDEFSVAEDGTLSLKEVAIDKVTGLEDRLSNVERAAVGGVHYRGSVATTDDLPADAEQGDLYEVTADNSEWCYNGEAWFEYGKTTNLSGLATAELNSTQLAITDNVLHITGIDSQLVGYRGQTLLTALDALSRSLVWEEFGTQVDLASETASDAISSATDGDTINFSDGTISAVTVDKSVTLCGTSAGLAQNFAQEVEA